MNATLYEKNDVHSSMNIIRLNPNEYSYLLPETSSFITEAVYGIYEQTITLNTAEWIQELTKTVIHSWGQTTPASFSISTNDLPGMLTLLNAARLSKNAHLTLSFGEEDKTPGLHTTPPQDARTFDFKQKQEVLNRDELDMFTMRSRLEQAEGAR